MSVPTSNSLLEAPWSLLVVFEHLRAVVGFDHQDSSLSYSLSYEGWYVSEVRYPSQTGGSIKGVFRSPLEIKTNRIVSVMGNAERMNFEGTERKRHACFENFPVRSPWKFCLDCLNGVLIGKNRQIAKF